LNSTIVFVTPGNAITANQIPLQPRTCCLHHSSFFYYRKQKFR